MKTVLPAKNRVIERQTNPQYILRSWIESIVDFYKYYNLLCQYVSRSAMLPTTGGDVYIGQCSIEELTTLMDTMCDTLENLGQVMEPLNKLNQASSLDDWKMLASHTLIISELNDKAKTRLVMAGLSAS